MGYQYDANGRLSQVNGPVLANATYTAAGQLSTLSYGGMTETRGYNNLGQLTSQYVQNYLNIWYQYSATQNNGRITNTVDFMTGENTAYTYDSLNRLVSASNPFWDQAYTYDGFGNLLSKNGAGGSGGTPNPAPNMTATDRGPPYHEQLATENVETPEDG
jgi:YD repeat-containing protein